MDSNLYRRPNKPTIMNVTRRRDPAPVINPEPVEILAVDGSTECHVTPAEIAARMVDYLEADKDTTVLEPHAGTGNLIQALIDSGHYPFNIFAVEKHYNLHESMRKRFNWKVPSDHDCIFNHTGKYSRIIANPPFKKIKTHMNALIDLLVGGGVLVALVPITYQHKLAEEMEILGNDVFPTAKVNTKIIIIKV